jgi:hypothetical protein
MADVARELDASARIAAQMRASEPCSSTPSLVISLLAVLLCLCSVGLSAQTGPVQGGTELQVWTAGGHSISGGRGDTGILDVGFRYGWILLDSHGPSFLRGRFEYALDAVPLYMIFQRANTAYGAGFNPLNLKWNFGRRRQIVPYLELSGGVLFTNHDVPTRTSSVNFTPAAAFGVHFLRERFAWTVEGRYLHISDAGLSRLNPGINTFEVHLGIGKFRR